MGAGLTGNVSVLPRSAPASSTEPGSAEESAAAALVEDLTVAPGIAPWVAGRIGIQGSNEAGLTYGGRSIRLDGRHAFTLGKPSTLSVGLGGSVVVARRPGSGNEGSVYGGGLDVPVLLGYTSTADIYSFWIGPRGGFEVLRGTLALAPPPGGESVAEDVGARHGYVGLVAGARVGFRHVHVALELDATYHFADGERGSVSMTIDQFTLTPAGALILSF
jgi:hypothetical protein